MERWRVWIETHPVDAEGWSERVDTLLEALAHAQEIEGSVGWGAGPALGSVFEVEAATAPEALGIGLEAFEGALEAAAGDLDVGIRRIEVGPDTYEPETLMGATDIARMLGVSRQRCYQLMERPGFPVPAAELARGALWRRRDIEAFASTRSGSTKRPPKIPA